MVGREAQAAFVSNMQLLASRLGERGYPNLHLKNCVFEGETHVSGVPGTLSRGLRVVSR